MSDIYQIIDVEVEIEDADSNVNAAIVGEIKKGEELIYWQGSDFARFGIFSGDKPKSISDHGYPESHVRSKSHT